MPDNPAETLPIAQRLALAYAPRRMREPTLTLLLLDNRLAHILRQRGETIIAQMKLAWWRDRLSEDSAQWPGGEPLLARLALGPVEPGRYLPLVNGWERLLGEELTISAIEEFAQGRALAWQALGAGQKGAGDPAMVARAAREWTLADLALHLEREDEALAARRLALAGTRGRPRLGRAMRPLAVLHALSLRALERGSAEPLDGPRAAMLALRIGLTGR